MSCSSNSAKTCQNKSCQRYYNNNAQAFAAGATIQLQIAGAKVVDSGISIETQPQSYTTVKTGLYHIVGDVVVDAVTAGSGTLQIFMDGVGLPCTIKNVTLPEGNTEIHTETDLSLTGCCCNVDHNFTYVFTSDGAAGTIVEFCSGMLKLA